MKCKVFTTMSAHATEAQINDFLALNPKIIDVISCQHGKQITYTFFYELEEAGDFAVKEPIEFELKSEKEPVESSTEDSEEDDEK